MSGQPTPGATLAGNAVAFERGMVLMIAAMLVIPASDATAKWLSATLSPGEISCFRLALQALLLAPLILIRRRPLGPHVVLQAVRGLLIAGATLCFFAAVQVMPLADCTAIFFVEPLILTVLSAIFLGEPIGWRRVAAIVVGFAGAMIVIQPSYRIFGVEALLPLGSALCLAVFLVLTRRLAVGGDPLMLQMSSSVSGAVALALVVVFGTMADIPVLEASWPRGVEWPILLLLGVITTAGHLMMIYAFSMTPAGVLAPFHYVQIIAATGLGLVLFGDFPTPTTLVGVAIIVGAGLYVFHRERVTARRA